MFVDAISIRTNAMSIIYNMMVDIFAAGELVAAVGGMRKASPEGMGEAFGMPAEAGVHSRAAGRRRGRELVVG